VFDVVMAFKGSCDAHFSIVVHSLLLWGGEQISPLKDPQFCVTNCKTNL
jgi:hypothetical protein